MENPGCVTYNSKFLYDAKPTTSEICERGMVIAHELAHMWFGDLVTMKWWDDLWLNESFADMMCYYSLYKISDELPFETIDYMSLFNERKGKGYKEDQMSTTHPIYVDVPNTSKAESIFDGITYCKGASVIKQLLFLIGEEKFSRNVGNYFKKYSWSNGTLNDFLNEIQKDVDYDLSEWKDQWIMKAGLN